MRSFRLFIIFVFVFLGGVFAQAGVNAYEEKTLTVHFNTKDIPTMIQGGCVLGIMDDSGNIIESKVGDVRREKPAFDISFNVGEYKEGDKFYVTLGSGASSLIYNCTENKTHEIEIKTDNSGKIINEFNMEIIPAWERDAVIYFCMDNSKKFDTRLMGDEVFVTEDLLGALGIKYSLQDGEIKLSSQIGAYSARLFLGSTKAHFGSGEYTLNSAPFLENGKVFIPLYEVAVYFACDYELKEVNEYAVTIFLSPSAYSKEGKNIHYVNKRDIESKTDFLIWISKSEYKVYVYKGENRKWRFVKALSCAIGAPKTPTVEGIFEYHQYQPRWTYPEYYCGPVMRFYKGYALHSTLIRYNGKPYDNRVGQKISHGCVRIRPEGINWLASYIPLGTTVLVTK